MNESDASAAGRAESAAFAVAVTAAAVGIAVRLAFLLTLPLVENDATIVFQAAREVLTGRPISMVQTLPTLLIAAIWKFTGESLFAASLPNFLAGTGTIILCYLIAKRHAGRTAGAMAAMIASAVPIAILFDSITKPYSLLSFFILAGIFCWQKGTLAQGRKPILFGVAAGLLFFAAFACHTFAAFAAFPLAIFFITGLVSKSHRNTAVPSLAAGLAFGITGAALVAWRFPVFGWSVFNDYIADWRFSMETAVWSARWEGLTNLFALAPFLIVPGAALCAALRVKEKAWPAGAYLWTAVAFNIAIYVLNPVNHFPRVMLPAAGPLAILAGVGITRAARVRPWAWYAAVGVCVLGAAWLVMETATGQTFIAGMMNGVKPAGFLAVTVIIAGGFFALGKIAAEAAPTGANIHGRGRDAAPTIGLGAVSMGLFAAAALLYGALHAQGALERQAVYYQGRLAAWRACQSDSNTVGGGDAVALLSHGRNNFSWLTDLPANILSIITTDGLSKAVEVAGITCVISAQGDPEGEQAMLLEYAKSHGAPAGWGNDLFKELGGHPDVKIMQTSERFRTYILPGHEAKTAGVDADLMRRYSPVVRTRWWK